MDDYLQLQLLPWKHDRTQGVTWLLAADPQQAQDIWATRRYGPGKYRWALLPPPHLQRLQAECFSAALSHQSCNSVHMRDPQASAKNTLNTQQRQGFTVFALANLALALWQPQWWLVAYLLFFIVAYVAFAGFKFLLLVLGVWLRERMPPEDSATSLSETATAATGAQLSDAQLPVYTVLIPLYEEATSVAGMITALQQLDYPRSKLDIKLIVEDDDTQTIDAIDALKLDDRFDLIRVPYSQPRTKPKACNYALHFARGELVTIFDAEDYPAPQELKEAALRLLSDPEPAGCMQARLNYYNWRDNLLTCLFSLEYAAWFDYMLPALEFLRIPLPLGGTSNHMRTAQLRALGAWDAYNVTEDADLGIRLAAQGMRTRMLHSLTLEEAPLHFIDWFKQRTRWIKGYMQTWLVHMRRPWRLLRRLGLPGFAGFQLFIGGSCLFFLVTPLLLIVSGLWYAGILPIHAHVAEPLLLRVATFGLWFGLWILAAVLLLRRPSWKVALGVVCFPFYWLLHSLASFRAVWQLVRIPHMWEKTPHGLTRKLRTQSLRIRALD